MAKFISLESNQETEEFIPLEAPVSEGFIPLESATTSESFVPLESSEENFVPLEAQLDFNFQDFGDSDFLPPIQTIEKLLGSDARSIVRGQQAGLETKAVPAELGKGAVRFSKNFIMGGPARIERIIGDVIKAFPEVIQDSVVDSWIRDGLVIEPTLDTLAHIGQTLSDHGSETSKAWAKSANTGWAAIEENSDTPIAEFVGQMSEAVYSSAIITGMAILTGGQSAVGPVLSAASKLSAQSKSILATFSALGASSAYEQIKDAGGTTLDALTQFGIQAAVEYFGESTAFGELFQGENVGVAKLTLNGMLEEGGVGFVQDVSGTFHVARLEGDSIEDSYRQAIEVGLSNLPQNTAGGGLGAATIGSVSKGVNKYKVAKYTNLVNSAKSAEAAVQQLEATAAKVIQNPAEVEASVQNVVHEMPDGSTMPGPEHDGSVPNSARQVEPLVTSEEFVANFIDTGGLNPKPLPVEERPTAFITKNTKKGEGQWRINLIDNHGKPLSHFDYKTEAEAQTALDKKVNADRLKLSEVTVAPPNPYLNPDMDIHRVLADSEHGVSLAQDAMAQRISELEYFEDDYARALQPESSKPIKTTAAELGEAPIVKTPKPKKPKPVQIKGLEDDKGKKVLANLRSISGNDANMKKISFLANSLGGVPESGAARTSFINDLNNVAKTQKAFDKKSTKLKSKDKRARIFNPWSEARYSLAEAEQITGRPFRRLYIDMIGKTNTASDTVSTGMLDALQSVGIKKGSVILNKAQANSVSDYLFEEVESERVKLAANLDERSVNVVKVLDDLLQGPVANEIRQARWYKWNDQYKSDILKVAKAQIKAAKAGKVITEEQFDSITKKSRDLIPRNVIDKVSDFETVIDEDGNVDEAATERNKSNAATQVLKEGIVANENNQLRDWIAGQKWGTRAHYYMSEGRISDLVDYVDTASVKEFAAETTTKAGKFEPEISATKERKGQSQKKGSRAVIRDVMQHWERASTFNAAHDDLVSFWDNFDSAITEFGSNNIDPKDVTNIRKLLNSTISKPVQGDELSSITSKAGNLFWTAYFADVSRAGRFAVRNLKQNVAYLSAELSPVEMTKAAARIATGKGASPQELSNFEEFWKSEISQKRQLFNHFIMSTEASQTEVIGHNLSRLTNSLGSLAMRSDEANRKVAWKMAYEISTHNLDLFNQGRIDYSTLESRLKIQTLNTSERLELKGLLNTSQSEGTNGPAIQEEFIKRYTSMKTMNTHFGYDLKHKSIIEQNPGNRQIIGPATYFRGRAQIINQSIIKPLQQAKQTGDMKQGREAIGNLIKFIVGSALAGKIAEKMGYEAYNLVGDSLYSPLSPGVGMAIEASQEIDFIISESGDEVEIETSVRKIAEVIGGLGELGVPMLNTMSQLYQARENVSGVTTMKRVQNLLFSQGWAETEKVYKDMDRNLYEKIGNVLWGGFDRPED